MKDTNRFKLSDELSVAINNVIHEHCKKIEAEPNNLANEVSMVVLYGLMMNLITFIDQICETSESKFKLLESHFQQCKNVLSNIDDKTLSH